MKYIYLHVIKDRALRDIVMLKKKKKKKQVRCNRMILKTTLMNEFRLSQQHIVIVLYTYNCLKKIIVNRFKTKRIHVTIKHA